MFSGPEEKYPEAYKVKSDEDIIPLEIDEPELLKKIKKFSEAGMDTYIKTIRTFSQGVNRYQ